MLTNAFRGHGTFIYLADETLRKFNRDAGAFVAALREAGMSHAWVRLHDYRMRPEPEVPTRRIIDALLEAGIAVAGWGFDAGVDPRADARATADLVKKYGLIHYVADIEQDEHDSQWTKNKVALFLLQLRDNLPPDAQILVSSYPYIKVKHPELMQAAAPHVEGFAPQIYWQNYPSASMLKPQNLPPSPSRPYDQQRDLNKPASYADLCLDWWQHIVGDKPLVLTGQAYWEGFPERPVSQSIAEDKMRAFLSAFSGWDRVWGINWWHFGSHRNTTANGAMTTDMFDSLVAAELDKKAFKVGDDASA